MSSNRNTCLLQVRFLSIKEIKDKKCLRMRVRMKAQGRFIVTFKKTIKRSSGCIRIQNSEVFSRFCLRDENPHTCIHKNRSKGGVGRHCYKVTACVGGSGGTEEVGTKKSTQRAHISANRPSLVWDTCLKCH